MPHAEVTRDGAILLVTMNRPKRSNAMTLTMFERGRSVRVRARARPRGDGQRGREEGPKAFAEKRPAQFQPR